jgi:hypothetical protein
VPDTTRYGRALARSVAGVVGTAIGNIVDDRFIWIRQVTDIWPPLALLTLDGCRFVSAFASTTAACALRSALEFHARVEAARERAVARVAATGPRRKARRRT